MLLIPEKLAEVSKQQLRNGWPHALPEIGGSSIST